MDQPLVSVICLCHNQSLYVQKALDSVISQTYGNVELVIVDDGSTDGSKEIIEEFIERNPSVPFVDIQSAVGNCRAFNRGWRMCNGDFVIDLAADDVLLPSRIEVGLSRFSEVTAGVHFSDAELMDAEGSSLGKHSDRFDEIPEGDLYVQLVGEYLICPPTMMIRREVLEKLKGYDESLAFEDFDFWVRSSREFEYCYSDEVLVRKRILKKSLSAAQRQFRNDHQKSILAVCRKALALNETRAENRALKKRSWYEIRQCIKKGNLGLIPDYLSIIKQC